MWVYLMKGGPVLIAIAAVSIAAGMFVIVQFIRLRLALRSHSKPLQELARLTQKRDWFEALRLLDKHVHPFLGPWRTAFLLLIDGKSDLQDIEETVSIEGQRFVARLESALRPLGALTTVLPMLGFLGTIIGLIASFHTWEQLGAQVSISALAGGIYQAMITTAAGLAFAIPYYLLFHILVSQTARVALNFSLETTQLFRWIKEGLTSDLTPEAKAAVSTTP